MGTKSLNPGILLSIIKVNLKKKNPGSLVDPPGSLDFISWHPVNTGTLLCFGNVLFHIPEQGCWMGAKWFYCPPLKQIFKKKLKFLNVIFCEKLDSMDFNLGLIPLNLGSLGFGVLQGQAGAASPSCPSSSPCPGGSRPGRGAGTEPIFHPGV